MHDAVAAVRNVLLGNDAVTALVGQRVRPWPANQMLEVPCVLVALVWQRNAPTMGGMTVDYSRVQVDCIASSHAQRTQCADAVRTALQNYSDGTVARVLFISASERTDDRSGHYGMVMEFDVIAR